VNYALIGANGDSIEFDYTNYILNPDFLGFGIPPAQVRIENSAGDGGVFRHAKRGVRTVDLPVTVLGTDRNDVQNKLRRLAKLTQNNFGALTLEARYNDGITLQMDLYYTGGAESQWGENAGNTWCKWVLSMQAPQPFWQSTTIEQFTVTRGNTGRGLLPQLSKLRISSSQALGTVLINNTGDVPMFPTYRVIGPISDFAVSSNGASFGFNEPLEAGEIIYINTETGEVYDEANANRYDILNPAPKLFRIPVGESSITISGTDVTDDTRVDVYYAKRYEVVH
jgi:phage-related protein